MLTHNTLACATKGCYAAITLHPDDEARLRRTHETFWCPAGHSNYFAGKTEQQKRIEQLEKLTARNRDKLSELFAQREETIGAMKECPLGCGWRSRRRPVDRSPFEIGRFRERVIGDFREHLVEEHGATLPEPVEQEASADV